jgi:hypothetical protein
LTTSTTIRQLRQLWPRSVSIPRDLHAAARDSQLLLGSGRAGMALQVIERLPDLIAAEIRHHRDGAYVEGRMAGKATMHAKMRPK